MPLLRYIIAVDTTLGEDDVQPFYPKEMKHLVFWGPRSFQFDLEMNINIYCMHYIIKEDYWRP